MNFYAHKFNNLASKLTQEETETINTPICIKEIAFTIKTFPPKETIGPDGFTAKFYQTLKAGIILILNKFSQITRGNTFQLIFYDHHNLGTKNTKTLKENYEPILS